ncbi:hypothetical protein [Methylophaga muralis]|nr:hypothetical protein [Methylophaga muralis]
MMQISHLQAKPFWEEDIREADFYLPVSKVINLRITNSSDSGFVIMSCSNIKSYNLKENEKYVMKIKNWSSVEDPGVFESSFGCKFDLINSSGNIEDEVTTDLPQCED